MRSAYTLPGDAVFPEGITTGPDSTFYVGSTRDGAIFRGRLDEPAAEVWQPAGTDDRRKVLGLTTHGDARLLACGGDTGHLFVYDLATGALLARRSVPADRALLNDVWVIGDTAYVTDSERPIVWKLELGPRAGSVGEFEVFAEVTQAGELPYLNGVVATPDGSGLLVAAQGDDSLWRVDLVTRAVTRVAVEAPFGADGLLLVGNRLIGVVNEGTSREDVVFHLAELRVADDGSRGEPVRRWQEARFDAPTTLAYADGRMLVVNSQLTRTEPALPFQVIVVPLPE